MRPEHPITGREMTRLEVAGGVMLPVGAIVAVAGVVWWLGPGAGLTLAGALLAAVGWRWA